MSGFSGFVDSSARWHNHRGRRHRERGDHGGQSYGRSGWDAKGRRYVCKGNRSHPHWMRP
ncbi:hypothetical protein GCM10009788_19510 [Nocardioides humi]|uniref:Uncharacterized protein n=1 Tax=Nocardioides humi TaxID=449461 RepID=A0ABN2AC35_9ACTN